METEDSLGFYKNFNLFFTLQRIDESFFRIQENWKKFDQSLRIQQQRTSGFGHE